MPDLPDWSTQLAYGSDNIVFNTANLGNPLGPGQSVSVSLIQYASLIIVAKSAGVMNLQLDFHQAMVPGGLGDTTIYTEYLTCIDAAQTPTWILPITAGSVVITNATAVSVDIMGYGTNRPSTKAMMLGGTQQPRQFSLVGAVTAGVSIYIPVADTGPWGTSFNGALHVRASSTAIGGMFGYLFVSRTGNLKGLYVGELVPGGQAFATCTQPLGIVRWAIIPNSTSATANVSVEVTQE